MSKVIVLCYHALSDDWPADLSVRPDRLAQQIELLLDRGYRATTFTRAIEARPSKAFAVTFDDAFRSVLTRGLPILDRFGIPATVFAVTGFPGGAEPLRWDGIDQWLGGPYEPELAGMSWEELRQLHDRGWEVGSHTVSHPHLPTLSEAGLVEEMAASKMACEEQLGVRCRSIAYPYGDVNDRVVRAARRAGYVAGAALPPKLGTERALEWPRVGVWVNDDLSRFKLKVSPSARLLRRMLRR